MHFLFRVHTIPLPAANPSTPCTLFPDSYLRRKVGSAHETCYPNSFPLKVKIHIIHISYIIFLGGTWYWHFLYPALNLKKNYLNWRIIALQYCDGFCHKSIWIGHRHVSPILTPSHLPPHPSPPGWPRARLWVPCFMRHTRFGHLFYTW